MSAVNQAEGDTATRILDSAERLVQTRGFNGFSYADIATELGVTKASLHYHFASKAELGLALIERYSERFEGALERIDEAGGEPPAKLAAYTRIFAEVLRDGRNCLCGMLAADFETLSEPMRAAVVAFFDENEEWLARVLADGTADGSLQPEGSARETAQALFGGLEGAMLLARPYGRVDRFEDAAGRLLASLAGSRAAQATG